jgi:hypothetical protein
MEEPRMAPVVARPLDEQGRIDEFNKLSDTQKNVIHFIYKQMHRNEISTEELYDLLRTRYGPDKIESKGELYYRLKVLELSHLVRLRSMGKSATNVVRDSVMETLITEENLFPS